MKRTKHQECSGPGLEPATGQGDATVP